MTAHIYKVLSQEDKDALQKYNAEAIQKFKSRRNLHKTTFLHDLHENTQDNSTTSNQDDQSPDYQESHYGNQKMHKDTFKGTLLVCFEYVPYTALTIVWIIKTINVRLD